MSSRYLIVTDGQTDGQTDESNLNTALCTSASRGKNMQIKFFYTVYCIHTEVDLFSEAICDSCEQLCSNESVMTVDDISIKGL